MRCRPRLAPTIGALNNAGTSSSTAYPATAAPCVGVDIGGSKVMAIRLSGTGQVDAVDRLPTPRSAAEIVEAVLSVTSRVLSDNGPAQPRPSASAARG